MSEKIKEIKKLLDIVKVTDWSQIGDRIDEIKLMLDNIKKPKRKPLSDGTLPLTDSELDSLAKILDTHKIYGVRLIFEKLEYKDYEGYCYYHEIVNIKAIAYLLERFDLFKKNG